MRHHTPSFLLPPSSFFSPPLPSLQCDHSLYNGRGYPLPKARAPALCPQPTAHSPLPTYLTHWLESSSYRYDRHDTPHPVRCVHRIFRGHIAGLSDPPNIGSNIGRVCFLQVLSARPTDASPLSWSNAFSPRRATMDDLLRLCGRLRPFVYLHRRWPNVGPSDRQSMQCRGLWPNAPHQPTATLSPSFTSFVHD